MDKVTTSQVLSVLAPIWHVKAETAREVRQRISAVMRWAIARGYREDNPADERVVAALGVTPDHLFTRGHFITHKSRTLSERSRTAAYWAAGAALRFLVLTAARSGEARNATWDEINTGQET